MSCELDLNAIRARERAASPGPWRAHDSYAAKPAGYVCTVLHPREPSSRPGWTTCKGAVAHLQGDEQGAIDAEFIAHARTDIPALIAEVDRLREALDIR